MDVPLPSRFVRRPLLLVAVVVFVPAHALGLDYRFPTSAEDYATFYPTAYVDHGGADWNCGDIYYAGHRGTDLGVGSWSGMAAGRDVMAAADGLVVATEDGWFDECSTADCPGGGGFGNHVVVLHADGKATYYAHLRQGSVAVSDGDAVTCGQKIGEVGSSGHSTGPHLHFEVRLDVEAASPYAGTSSDPFDGPCSAPPSYWVNQGSHGGLPALQCDGDPGCAPHAALVCGQAVTAASDGEGSTLTQLDYACTDYTYTGPELAWSFTAAHSEPVTLALTGLGADLDLFVLDASGCDGTACFASSVSPDGEDEGLTFEATAGSTYTVIVDGWEGAASTLTLLATCTPPDVEDETPTDRPADDDSAGPDDDDSATPSPPPPPGPFFPTASRLPSPQEPVGCSCRSPVHDGAAALVVPMGLVLRRRRRPPGPA